MACHYLDSVQVRSVSEFEAFEELFELRPSLLVQHHLDPLVQADNIKHNQQTNGRRCDAERHNSVRARQVHFIKFDEAVQVHQNRQFDAYSHVH